MTFGIWGLLVSTFLAFLQGMVETYRLDRSYLNCICCSVLPGYLIFPVTLLCYGRPATLHLIMSKWTVMMWGGLILLGLLTLYLVCAGINKRNRARVFIAA